MRTRYWIGIIVIVLSTLGIGTGWAAERQVAVTYTFNGLKIDKVTGYMRVSVNGSQPFHRIGQPEVPFRTGRIVLPPGASVANVSADLLGKIQTIIVTNPLTFGRTPMPIGIKNHPAVARAAQDKPDQITYEADVPYPDNRVQLVSVQKMNGYSIAIVRIFPVQYQPASGKLLFCPMIKVIVTLGSTVVRLSASPMRTLGTRVGRVKAFVDNPDAIISYETSATLNIQPLTTTYDYLLVTRAALTNAFQPLVVQKVADGLSVKVATVEDILANYAGVDDAAKLRAFITYAYNNWNTTYVLLGGDISTVPYRQAYAYCDEADATMPCDLYFACLDGSWNSDNDGNWGEPHDGEGGGDVDLIAEVYVGRAPVDNVTEVANFINKTLYYEQNKHKNVNNVRFLAEYLGNYSGVYAQGGDGLDGALPSFLDYNVDWLDDRPTNAQTWNVYNCLAALNQSPHIVVHDGHANQTYALRMNNNNIDSLTNTVPFLLNSIGCYCGAFDNSDCFAEELVKRNAYGAFSVIMNSRFGWFETTDEGKFSGEFVNCFFDQLLVHDQRNIGKANQLAKEDMLGSVETAGDMVYRWCYFEITLFGDPHTVLQERDALHVIPSTEFNVSGYKGGPFVPSSKIYTLTNTSASALEWTSSSNASWVDLAPTSGTLAAGTSIEIIASLNAEANNLGSGDYDATLIFQNVTSGTTSTRVVALNITLPLPLSIDQPNWVITTGGDVSWFGQSNVTHDSTDAAQSGIIEGNQSSEMTTTVTGPVRVKFWYRVSSETGYDFFKVYVGDEATPCISDSGDSGWKEGVIDVVENAAKQLKFIYIKDEYAVGYQDCAWVDQVTIDQITQISFNTQKPGVILLSKNYVIDEPFGELPTPISHGSTFIGWFIGETEMTIASIVPASPVSLVARWSDGYSIDGVEYETSFATNGFKGWTVYDGDKSGTYGIIDEYDNPFIFPNSGAPMAFIVFNPSLTVPSLEYDTELIPASGLQYFASFAATSPPNNDWLISTALSIPEGYVWTFMFKAKTYTSTWGLERFRVLYSTTDNQIASFMALSSGSYIEAPTSWTTYKYDLPAGTKYVAINCVSYDAFIFMLDDLAFEWVAPKVENVSVPYTWLQGYNLGVNTVLNMGTNGYPVWQSYVAGLIPTNPISQLLAYIAFTNGHSAITWTPDISPNRAYTVQGKTNLTDVLWHTPTNTATRFFRVNVDMPTSNYQLIELEVPPEPPPVP